MKRFKKMSKVLTLSLAVCTAFAFTACSSDNTDPQASDAVESSKPTDQAASTEGTTEGEPVVDLAYMEEQFNIYYPIIESKDELPQLSEVKDGETIAIMKTNYGDVTMRFFEEQAPLAVENFLTHAKDGYYDGVTFHRVINDFMIQGGDPEGTGTGGESIYGGTFNDEISPYLKHFSGAVAMAKSGPNTNGSQFYIVENDKLDDASLSEMEFFKDSPEDTLETDPTTGYEVKANRFIAPPVAEEYIKNGGTPSLDFNYTVFGQVIDGMDVVHKIADVDTYTAEEAAAGTGLQDKPKEDVIINSIEVTTYKK